MSPDTFAGTFAAELRESLVWGNTGKFAVSSGISAGS